MRGTVGDALAGILARLLLSPAASNFSQFQHFEALNKIFHRFNYRREKIMVVTFCRHLDYSCTNFTSSPVVIFVLIHMYDNSYERKAYGAR